MLYPSISSYINCINYNNIINKYTLTTNNYSENKNIKLLNKANNYNKQLDSSSIIDIFSNPQRKISKEYFDILNINGKGLMGYINIPKINIKIPIYHGTNSEVLEKGVGHLEGSSFPIGGTSTHAILSAHRGLPSSKLFTDLDQLKIGDKFYIYILDKSLAYEVDQILEVEPSNMDELQIKDGENYVTLVTCTPYGINTHRLLVRGTQVEYVKQEAQETKIDKKTSISDKILYIGLIIPIIILLFVNFQVIQAIKNQKNKTLKIKKYKNRIKETKINNKKRGKK